MAKLWPARFHSLVPVAKAATLIPPPMGEAKLVGEEFQVSLHPQDDAPPAVGQEATGIILASQLPTRNRLGGMTARCKSSKRPKQVLPRQLARRGTVLLEGKCKVSALLLRARACERVQRHKRYCTSKRSMLHGWPSVRPRSSTDELAICLEPPANVAEF